MANRKPIVQVVLTEKYFNKIKALSEQEGRSTSNQSARILEKFIDEYESEHGEIPIQTEK